MPMEVTVKQAAIADERRIVRLIREARRVYIRFKLEDLRLFARWALPASLC
jgi:hypothetical protein